MRHRGYGSIKDTVRTSMLCRGARFRGIRIGEGRVACPLRPACVRVVELEREHLVRPHLVHEVPAMRRVVAQVEAMQWRGGSASSRPPRTSLAMHVVGGHRRGIAQRQRRAIHRGDRPPEIHQHHALAEPVVGLVAEQWARHVFDGAGGRSHMRAEGRRSRALPDARDRRCAAPGPNATACTAPFTSFGLCDDLRERTPALPPPDRRNSSPP